MLLAESAADRQTIIVVTLVLVAAILAIAFLVLRLTALLFDNDTAGIWVVAIDPQEFAKEWESPLTCALMAERICGASYFDLIWQRDKSKTPEEHRLMYDNGIKFFGASCVSNAIADASKNWQRSGVFKSIPSIRYRLDTQLNLFTKVAKFALSKNLVLFLVRIESNEVPQQYSAKQIAK